MKIFFSANFILEFILNRSIFAKIVEDLLETLKAEPFIQPYMSQVGLNKILAVVDAEKAHEFCREIKNIFTILIVNEAILEKARSSSAIDPESAIEVALAIEANIKAIVTGKPNDFSKELNIISLSDLKTIQSLERNFSKDAYDRFAVVVINLEKALNLPSYSSSKLLEPNKSSHRVEITYLPDKMSSHSLDILSSQSTHARSITQIFLNTFSQPILALPTAQINTVKPGILTFKDSPDTLKASIELGLSMKSFARSTAYADVPKLHSLGRESLTRKTSIDTLTVSSDRGLSIKSPDPQSIGQLKSTRIGGLTATAPQPYENSLGGKLPKDILQMEKGLSFAIDSTLIKSPDLQSIGQLKSTRISGITATVPQPYENSLGGKLPKNVLQMEKGLSFAIDSTSIKFSDRSSFDRYGLLSQIKLLESMQRANTLDSYLSRKN
jgi:predicted nucleic acid-binding protein